MGGKSRSSAQAGAGKLIGTALLVTSSLPERLALPPMLRRAGVGRVLLAGQGTEALTIMSRELVELALIPWDGPEPAGAELLPLLLKRGQNRRVAVVILDKGLPAQAMVSAIKAGAAGRIPLPAQPEPLAKLLEKIANESTSPKGGSSE